jgi:CelD/BcsL family acetyltransferase involved in cellulose biosynthesis
MSSSAQGSLRLERLDSIGSMRAEWNELALKSGNVFATWEWASTWWRHFGRDRKLFAFACRSAEGELVAILPLYLWSTRPFRVLRFLGHGPADELGPICDPSRREEAARTLRLALSRGGWDVFLGELLPGEQPWARWLGARELGGESSPKLDLRGMTWASYLASRSPNFRQQVRRRERNLERHHDVGYRLADDARRLTDDLDLLFQLHVARWGQGSPFSRWEGFHRDFASQALERGWVRLWFLKVDGKAVAAWYGFRFAGVDSYYQAGRDLAWGESSVGFVLLAHTVRRALMDGMREYRFLRGEEAYKFRFTDADSRLETVALSHGLMGRAVLAARFLAGASRPVENAVAGLVRLLRR